MKKYLITGFSSGFGKKSAKYLAEKHFHVYATMRSTHGINAKVAHELKEFGKANDLSLKVLDMDVTSDESVNSTMSKVPEIDVLINNAGLNFGGPIEAFTSHQCLYQLDLNIVGTLRTAKAVLPKMRKRHSGLIIQVSSIAGRGAFPGFGIYHASKWGLEGLSESMRYKLAPLGIDVSNVEPGPFDTNFFGNMIPSKDEEIVSSYSHVSEFFEGFGKQTTEMFKDDNAPTHPMIVVKIFENLINLPAGARPLRTIAGLDFGFQELNDAVEPIRKKSLESMGILAWDGPVLSTN